MRGGGGRNGRRGLTWEDSEKAPPQSGPWGRLAAHNMVEGRGEGRKRGKGNAVMEEVEEEGQEGEKRNGTAVCTEEAPTVTQMLPGRHR